MAKIVGVLPADGWLARVGVKHVGHMEPLIGWAVMEDGTVEALIHKGEGRGALVSDTDGMDVVHEDWIDGMLLRESGRKRL